MPSMNETGPAPVRRSLPTFVLAGPPDDGRAKLAPGEAEHALRVRRLGAGDSLLAIDGEGSRWRLRITAVRGRKLDLETEGPPEHFPAPGEAGAPLPWVEIAVAWPQRSRAEAMIGPLVQLGTAAITPLRARFGGANAAPEDPPERWHRIAAEACKQCGRAWMPRWGPRLTPEEFAQSRAGMVMAVLDPSGGISLDTWLRSLVPSLMGVGTRGRPIVLVIGPEGGLAPDESAALLAADATFVRTAPHILRVETAATAAMALAGAILMDAVPEAATLDRG
jgi:16S rRNA (uracil1498-N3)-methyltransferase